MAGIDPTRDAEYLRLKFLDIVRRMSDLESGKLLALVASLTNTPYTVLRTGMMIPTLENVPGGGVLLPGGLLWSDGSDVSRVVYVGLWTAMGQPDTGDGDTTFTLVDTTDRAPYGAGGDLALLQAAGAGRSASHNHSITSGNAHDHQFQTGGSHTHTLSTNTDAQLGGAGRHVTTTNTGSDGGHGHNFTAADAHDHGGNTGSGGGSTGGFGVKWLVKI